jgi:hypothetical protein
MVPIENSSGANERVLSPEDAVCFIIHIINFFQFYDVNHLMAHRFSILIIGYEYLYCNPYVLMCLKFWLHQRKIVMNLISTLGY